MQRLRFTLVADGPFERSLIPILTWLLREHCGAVPIEPELPDLRRLRSPPRELFERIRRSVELYPCDLLFVHRDAEGESVDKRIEEICDSRQKSGIEDSLPAICVVPVRMQEAWLLIDEAALRRAAGNPNGRESLNMPNKKKLEDLPNPKETFRELLRKACGHKGRRLKRFNRDLSSRSHQVSRLIDDFQPLRELAAFQRLEREIVRVVNEEGWANTVSPDAT